MESINLHTLANSLPTAQQNAEKELSSDFKAAALSITTLYRSSRKNAKRAHNAGYATACQDLLTMIQQGVSLNAAGHDSEGGGMTIGRVMDWTEARLEEIRSREDEEDEEEEREKEKEGGRTRAAAAGTVGKNDKVVKANVATTSAPRYKDHQPPSLLTPKSPHGHLNAQLPSVPSSPSPPLPGSLRTTQRPLRPRAPPKADLTASYASPSAGGAEFNIDSFSLVPPSSVPLTDIPIPIAAGAKRRHAMMMMLDSSTPPVAIGSSSTTHPSSAGAGNNTNNIAHGSGSVASRRRTRSTRNLALQQSQNQNLVLAQAASEAMDVEEDGGRERKRVARR